MTMTTVEQYFQFLKELNEINKDEGFDEKEIYDQGDLCALKKDGRDFADEADEYRKTLGGQYETMYDRDRDIFCHRAEFENDED